MRLHYLRQCQLCADIPRGSGSGPLERERLTRVVNDSDFPVIVFETTDGYESGHNLFDQQRPTSISVHLVLQRGRIDFHTWGRSPEECAVPAFQLHK